MKVGQIFLGVMCNERGGIIDDLTVYRLGQDEYMMVTNAGTKDKDYNWILKAQKEKGLEVEIADRSSNTAKLDLQGPKSEEILAKLTDRNLAVIPFYHFVEGKVEGVETIISRSGYTGEAGFELYFPAENAVSIWNKLLEVGKPLGLQPIGLGARDTLRLECSMNLYGHEINEEITPLEGRYRWVVDFDSDFIGKDVLVRQQEDGLEKQLIGFEMIERGIPRAEYQIFKDGQVVGKVTSGTFSPTIQKSIGMGFIKPVYCNPGTEIEVQIRNKNYKAVVVKCPFYKRAS